MKRLLLLFLLFPIFVSAQDLQSMIVEAEATVANYFEENNLPGLAVSIYLNDEMIWSEGFGYANIEDEIPVDPASTKFRIGSVSKTLTAAALGDLLEKRMLDLDTIVQTYVPSFPLKEYPITVRQVAGHIAGIRHYRGIEFMSTKLFETVEEGLTIFKDDPLLFEPGERYSYSSYGWNLISAVVEGASEEDFLGYMDQHVFAPLEMNNTVPEWTNREIPNLTSFYVPLSGGNQIAPYVDNSYKWAGGGFVGTTEDLIRFGVAYLDYGYQSEETHMELMTPLATDDGESTNYGVGWRTNTNDDRIWLGHTGGSVGGTTLFMLNKEHRMVVAFTINRSNVDFDGLQWDLVDIFLGE
jgi:CubicO group peptidase (beta-lactamase class C family)